jgi:hypothetical protein
LLHNFVDAFDEPMSERRTSSRRKISVAAEIDDGEGRKVVAVSRDASESGFLLLMQVPIPVGTRFQLYVMRPGDEPPLKLNGRVVRTKLLELEYADVWSYKVAVELIDPPADLPKVLDEIAAKTPP